MDALLLIDLQVDFLSPDGRMPIALEQTPGLLLAANAAHTEARRRGFSVVAIGSQFPRWNLLGNLVRRFAALEGSPRAAWDPRAPQQWDTYFAKRRPSAFTNPALEQWLRAREVTRLHLAGVMAGICIAATAKASLERGYRVSLVEEAIGAPSDRARDTALAKLQERGCEISDLARRATPSPWRAFADAP
jgi:nicotinamidase-related amidase